MVSESRGTGMRYCARCVLPNTKPGVRFDRDGICSACRSVERKREIDWTARSLELATLCDEIRGANGNGYDCIVPVSGGKDSMFQAWTMSKVHKLKVLGVIVAPHLQTFEGIQNLNTLVDRVGIDLVKISVRPSTLKKIRNAAFFKIGNPNWAEHRVVFAGVARTALLYHVPLVVWGEDIAMEFGGTLGKGGEEGSAEDLINNDLFREASMEDLVGSSIGEEELFFYMHPDPAELRRRGIRSIYLGYYHWWDGYRNYEKARELGFQARRAGPLSGNVLDYDNIDEKLCEIHIWFKFLKLGFWRPTDQCCYQIWNGRMTRADAVDLVNEKQYEFPAEYLPEFLEYHQISEQQFWECAERWRNPRIWHRTGGKWRLRVPLT